MKEKGRKEGQRILYLVKAIHDFKSVTKKGEKTKTRPGGKRGQEDDTFS